MFPIKTARKGSLIEKATCLEWRRQLRKKERAPHLEKERKRNRGKTDT